MRRRTVNDVMTRAVVSAYRDASFNDIARVMVERGITAMPVIDKDHHVAGVVSETDLLAKEERENGPNRRRLGRRRKRPSRTKAQTSTAEQLMSTPAITVRPQATIVEAARLLEQHKIKRVPVTDDANRLVGIVSRRDLLRVFTRTDDDIRDEILHEIFARLLMVDPGAVSVRVTHGVVTLAGTLPQESLIPIAVRLTAATDGVVSVIDELSRADQNSSEAVSPHPRH